jgi:hypothetical protein
LKLSRESSQKPVEDLSLDVRQPEVAALEAVGQLRVVDLEEVGARKLN